ncbi:Arsenite methyltransferase [subsurface metagenome]|nr:arsenite methyltransferase [bacterium]
MEKKNIRKVVREGYARIAKQVDPCCAPANPCCGNPDSAEDISKKIGYTEEELKSVPEGSNLGLGCGNPVALASLKEGETVLDLGAGAGFDCFLAANKVGKKGKVIGVDMTPEMLEKARENVEKGGYDNVEFRLGEIENLPVADNSVDAIISNCVINLAPDKRKVFEDAFRVLRPEGRLMVSDIVLLKELPEEIMDSVEAYVGCIAGAILKDEYIKAIEQAGFQDVRIEDETSFLAESVTNDPTAEEFIEKHNIPLEKVEDVMSSIQSIKVFGIKPKQ